MFLIVLALSSVVIVGRARLSGLIGRLLHRVGAFVLARAGAVLRSPSLVVMLVPVGIDLLYAPTAALTVMLIFGPFVTSVLGSARDPAAMSSVAVLGRSGSVGNTAH